MLNRPEPACLLIADISGYTGYLADAELDHAQDILADLIATVVGALRPTFRLAKLEGDAAFTWAALETLDGSALQDLVESCYVAFRRRLRDIRQASTCDCNACILIPNLDLKFVVHHGLVVRQRIMGRDELAGSDVIVAHRLLKNSVEEVLGLPAYALYTGACAAAMGLADPAAAGLRRHVESYEHVGDIVAWVRDLHAVWTDREAAIRVVVEPADAGWSLETFLPVPPSVAWDWMTSPARRPRWQDGVDEVREATTGGRRGNGTTNHCMHGRSASIEEIVDWRPFEHVTIRFIAPVPGAPKLLMTDTFEAVEGGTRHTSRLAKPRGLREKAFLALLLPALERAFARGFETLLPLMTADAATRAAEAAATPEPDLPSSARRFETQPIRFLSNPDGPDRRPDDGDSLDTT